jgi:DNA-binding transcriptional MerR regulator
VQGMTIGQLAARSGLSVRRLRFYADVGVFGEVGRSESGYRLFGPDAVARARLVRTLRELGLGLDDVKRVLVAEASLADVAAAHARTLDAQIRTLRLQRAVLSAIARSTNAEELERMTDLTLLTAEQRRRILEDNLDAVFGDQSSPRDRQAAHGRPRVARRSDRRPGRRLGRARRAAARSRLRPGRPAHGRAGPLRRR